MKLPESVRSRARAGFTLIELLVVIVIIAVLAATGGGAYMHFIEQARQSNASDTCAQIAAAWTHYHQQLGFWPQTLGSGVQKMDTEMCEILGKAGLLDVLYIDDNEANTGLTRNRDNEPELAVGLLSPIGLDLFEKGVRGSRVEDHLYHFVLDSNEDGMVDGSDGLPGSLGNVKVRGDAAVWCWPESEDARNDGEVFGCNW